MDFKAEAVVETAVRVEVERLETAVKFSFSN
jgi:hypothetical protein